MNEWLIYHGTKYIIVDLGVHYSDDRMYCYFVVAIAYHLPFNNQIGLIELLHTRTGARVSNARSCQGQILKLILTYTLPERRSHSVENQFTVKKPIYL